MNTTRWFSGPSEFRPGLMSVLLLMAFIAQLAVGGNDPNSANGFAPFVENTVLVAGYAGLGTTIFGTAFVVDCQQGEPTTPSPTLSCILVTAQHNLSDVKGQQATVFLREKRFQTLHIRQAFMVGSFDSIDRSPVVPAGMLELSVGQIAYPLELPPGKNTLSGLRDVLNGMATYTGVFASIVNSGTDQTPRYALRINPNASINHPEIEVAVRQHGSAKNLLVESPLWTTHSGEDIDLALMEIEVPKAFERYRLNVDDFADQANLKELGIGDFVWCIGYPYAQSSAETGFAGVRSGTIFSYPFPPPKNTPTFSIDAAITHGESGGACISFLNPLKPNLRPKIVGIAISKSVFPEQRQWSDGSETRSISLHVGQILKATLIREAIDQFRKKNSSAPKLGL